MSLAHMASEMLAEKDAEIERLNALITELADALDIMTQMLLISDVPLESEECKRRENKILIQRAREATK